MLSDALYEADKAIHDYQTRMPDLYEPIRYEINAIRCRMVVLQMRLDQTVPDEWLEKNPIYAAAKAGNIGPHDAYMHDEDDSVLDNYRLQYAAYIGGQPKE
ncbi:hypothetical protein EXN61_14290 [Agrobacterium tumefaciens]|uniref:Uncharacterized protein n=1 Tax=Agrobacterium tumefaciens TaxID=358 RepID=A0A546Y017_AGRTU|nr:hypothetical protein [Agrobacterium tumefaciens]TRB06342.1 hypothetical protein EXN61_14290 [Agrobacterium tumefaciens]